ncbi:radical SAM protein [candidate division KSB1 bacterium]
MSKFIQYTALINRGIKNYITKKPLCVSFETTYSCNAKCKHCHLGGMIKDEVRAAPEKYREICRQIKPVVAQVSGGEPLLRQDLEEVIRAIKNPNNVPLVVLTTNAALLNREKYDKLVDAGVDEFSVSFDYPDERHDDFRGIPGLYNKIVNLLESVKDEKCKRITLACVIHTYNYKELMNIAEFAYKWGVKVSFSTYTWLRTHKKDYLIPKKEIPELKEMINKLLEFKKKYNTVFTSKYVFGKVVEFFENESIPDCRTGEKFLIINPDGTLSPCGLIAGSFNTKEELVEGFLKTNTCTYCNTSIRANTEKPAFYLIRDNLNI